MKRDLIYLDYGAATPLDPRVLKEMRPYLKDRYANPSSLHSEGRRQREKVEQYRRRIAKILGSKATEIIFTSGSTESANLAIQGVARAFPESKLVGTAVEHEAVLQALESTGHPVELVKVSATGMADADSVSAAIDDKTVLVAVQYANNEIGTLQPITKIGQMIAKIRQDRTKRGVKLPIYFYCDAAQAGLQSLQVSRLGVDLLSMGGSKIYGPAGTGFLYVRTGVQLESLWRGGGQESGLRGGTENVPGIVGLVKALELIQESRNDENQRQQEIRDYLWAEISTKISNAKLNGSLNLRIAGNLNFSLPGTAGETLVAYLDQEGFAVTTGSACTAANQEPSHVLMAIGKSKTEAESSLRISLGRQTSKADAAAFVTALKKVLPRVRDLSAKS